MAGAVAGALPADARWVGVDGCPGGWFAVAATDDGTVGSDRYDDFASLFGTLDAPERVLVDLPIGLQEDGVRRCDERVRELLGCRAASVFVTPVRAAILEADDHDEAGDLNEDATGNRVTIQAWSLREKIRELDEFLGPEPLDHPSVRESHPELVFAALQGQPLAFPKSSPEGRDLRLAVLETAFDEWAAVERAPRDLYQEARERFARSDVADDDVLDALALVAGARCELTPVPAEEDGACALIHYPDRRFDWETVGYFSG